MLRTFFIILQLLIGCSLFATSYSWNVDSDGNWEDPNNWLPNTNFPNAPGDQAVIEAVTSVPRRITLNQDITIGKLYLDGPSQYQIHSYTNTLIFDTPDGSNAQLFYNNPIIFINVLLNKDLDLFSSGSNSFVTFEDGTISGNHTITLNGSNLEVLFTSGSFIGNNITINNNNSTLDFANRSQSFKELITAGVVQNINSITLSNPTGTLLSINGGSIGNGTINLSGSTTADDVAYNGAAGGSISSNIDLGSFTRTFNIGGTGSGLTIFGNISNGGIDKTGSGSLTLGGNNTYSGITRLTSGSISVSSIVDNLGNSQLVFNGGSLLYTGSGETNNLQFTINPGMSANISVSDGVILSIDGATSASNGSLTLNGSGTTGTLTLTAANLYTGATRINNGTLALSGSGSLSSSTALSLPNANGATFDISTLVFKNITLSSLNGTTNTFVSLGSNQNTLTIGSANTSDTYAGIISGSNGSLTKVGTNKTVLTGTNTFAGRTTLTSGTISVSTINNGGSPGNLGAASNLASNLVFSGGTLLYTGSGETTDRQFTINTTAIIGVNDGVTLVMPGAPNISNGNLIVNGGTGTSGTLRLTGPSGYTGATTISAGKLQAGVASNAFGNGSDVTLANVANTILDLNGFNNTIGSLSGGGPLGGNVTLNGGTLTIGNTNSTNYAGIISGNGSLIFNGSNSTILTLSNANTFNGSLTVNSGGIILNASGALPNNAINNGGNISFAVSNATSSSSLVTNNSGSLDFQNTTQLFKELSMTSGSASNINSLTLSNAVVTFLTMGDSSLNDGTIHLNGTATANDIVYNGTVGSSINSNIDFGTNVRTLNVGSGGSGLTISGIVSNGGVNKIGNGVLTLSGNNTYSGGTTINAGTIQVTSNNNLGNDTGNTITFNGGTLQDTSNLSFSSSKNITLDTNGGIIQIDDSSESLTLSGAISGGDGNTLTKQGPGTLIFNGSDKTYSGDTNVIQGTLEITSNNNNFYFQSNINLSDGTNAATLLGNFKTNKTITIEDKGIISPGNSLGTISATNIIFQPGSKYLVQINPITSDLIAETTGSVTINGGTLEVQPLSMALKPGYQYFIISSQDGSITGQFDNIIFDNPSIRGTVSYNQTNGNLAGAGPTYVILTLDTGVLTDSVSSGNPGAVANYLDSLNPPRNSDLRNILNILAVLPPDEMAEALNQLHPAQYKGLVLTQESNTFNIRGLIQEKASDFYQHCCIKKGDFKKKVSLWITPYSSFLVQNDNMDIDLLGFKANSVGFAVGSDCMLRKNWILGGALAYSFTDFSGHSHRGGGNIYSIYASIYSSCYYKRFFIHGSFLGVNSFYNARRNINFATPSGSDVINRQAKTSHYGYEFLAHLNTGLIFYWLKSLEFKPFLGLDYSGLRQQSFKEEGADSLDLRVKRTFYDTYRIEAGSNLAICVKHNNNKILPELKFSYIREIRTNGKNYRSNLKDEPGSFVVYGLKPNRSIFSPGASITTHFHKDNRGSFAMRYNVEIAKKYAEHLVNLEIAYRF